MIQWNEGLSVGVKALDDDHKKLLTIINQLSFTIDNSTKSEENRTEFEAIFSELEKYITQHFTREETFLKKCKYIHLSEHQLEHQNFAHKIPKLKEQFFSTDNYLDAKEISYFLTDWLVNHIINEDMKFIPYLEKCNVTDQAKIQVNAPFIEKLIKKTTHTFSFSQRIFISAIIPLTGMLFFSFYIIFQHYQEYKSVENISKLSTIIYNINDITHNLQKERGLSSGYLSSTKKSYKLKLHHQRNKLDISIQKFLKNIKHLNKNEIHNFLKYVKSIDNSLSLLPKIREDINTKTISKQEEINFYSILIKKFLITLPNILTLSNNNTTTSEISSLTTIFNMKELLAQEKAYGVILIENANRQNYNQFVKLLGIQTSFYEIHQQLAQYNYHDNNLETSLLSKNTQKIQEYKKNILNNEYQKLDSQSWFELISIEIDEIKNFIDTSIEKAEESIADELTQLFNNLLLLGLITLTLLLSTRFIIFILGKSTSKQIIELTIAMRNLAFGGKSVKLKSDNKNDQIYEIYKAYELTRQQLLKGDIFTQLYKNREKAKFENQKRENLKLEEMAFVDTLTQIPNRRKFNEVAVLEIQRALRYQHNLALLMLDIDLFKKINDTYGHSVGDEVLKHFAVLCNQAIRDVDTFARVGGEEFIILLPETNRDGAYNFAQRLRKSISESSISVNEKTIKFTMSIGITLLKHNTDTQSATLVQRADEALYVAKNSGRNCVEVL